MGFCLQCYIPKTVYTAYQTFKKHEKMEKLPAIGEKPEECAIIEAKRREHFKKDWLKLCNGHEENQSNSSNKKVVLVRFSTCQIIYIIYDIYCSRSKEKVKCSFMKSGFKFKITRSSYKRIKKIFSYLCSEVRNDLSILKCFDLKEWIEQEQLRLCRVWQTIKIIHVDKIIHKMLGILIKCKMFC